MDKIRNKEIKEIMEVLVKPDIIDITGIKKITVVLSFQKNARAKVT